MEFQVIFGGVIAYVLLALYAGTVGYMTYMVAKHQTKEFSSGVTYTVTLVGGLVSALVVAKLAVTEPGDVPAMVTKEAKETGAKPDPLNEGLTVAYMVVWMVAGLAALVVGVMLYADVNKSLALIGTTWLGLAVASGYAYFGLQPKPPQKAALEADRGGHGYAHFGHQPEPPAEPQRQGQ